MNEYIYSFIFIDLMYPLSMFLVSLYAPILWVIKDLLWYYNVGFYYERGYYHMEGVLFLYLEFLKQQLYIYWTPETAVSDIFYPTSHDYIYIHFIYLFIYLFKPKSLNFEFSYDISYKQQILNWFRGFLLEALTSNFCPFICHSSILYLNPMYMMYSFHIWLLHVMLFTYLITYMYILLCSFKECFGICIDCLVVFLL